MEILWLNRLAELYLFLCLLSFLFIIRDQSRRPAPMMRVMLWVWPINALWAGPLGLWAYFRLGIPKIKMKANTAPPAATMGPGRTKPERDKGDKNMDGMNMGGMNMGSMNRGGMNMGSMNKANMDMDGKNMPKRPISWENVVTGTLHCGAGCSLADLIGPWLFRLFPFALWGSHVFGEWALDYVLALIIGVGFQYAGLAAMSKSRGPALWWRAFRVDVLSLSSWQVGMYGWMAVAIFGLFGPLSPTEPLFWLMMQLSMAFGFLTACPMNWLLLHLGIKSPM